MAAEIRTIDWRGRRYHRRHLVWLCRSRSLRGRDRRCHRQEGGPNRWYRRGAILPMPKVPCTLERFRRHLLAVPAGCDVSSALQC